MEDRTDSPIAVKVEEHNRYVILTYFQGDINSMVDAHFNRALSKVCKAKAPAGKTKKFRKPIKLGKQINSDYKQDDQSHLSSLRVLFLCPLQRRAAPVRAVLLTVTQSLSSLLQQDV